LTIHTSPDTHSQMANRVKLTPTEERVAIWICRGKSLAVISSEMGIAPVTLRVHLSRIRAKSRQPDLDKLKIASFLTSNNLVDPVTIIPQITPAQRSVLALVASGLSYGEIGAKLSIRASTAENHAMQGCKRLGITGLKGHPRQVAIAKALDGGTMDDPMFW